ncbi:PAS domain-containing sensor histidine kinase [Thalassotalea insulae]|uniref:histidine kinase n=1 Tax=Thalassotalea insulae TaxID=2056778 RepID=A0ABQ6GTR5_9GAMM|nr:phosphate regulon sensor histidine kinase PhoR [Thalassotalea insulae]GLX79335.1 PAS domain-containing sensor histidine kinase [Thalassotalea insulae]
MYFQVSISTVVSRLIIILCLSAVVGYLTGNTFLVVAVSATVLLAWHYHHLLKLAKWLWRSKSLSPPHAEGIWGMIYDGLYRQMKKSRNKQKQLNEKVRRFRDGAEALPDAALVLSEDLMIEWGNKKAQRLLGIRWPGDVGQRIDNLLRFPEFITYLESGVYDTPCIIQSPVNNELMLELRLIPYGTDQVLFLARDISKIHRLEEMRRDFVANVSHELKTPLTVVRGYVEMVQSTEHALDPYWLKVFTTMETQVSRMDRLVEQLLVLSRVEINIDEDEKQVINMPKMIKALVDDSQWLNQEKQHQLTTDIDETLAIEGLDNELKSACSNLISNAIAYTPAEGHIHVSWKKSGNKACFSVKDDGPGIRPEHVNRLTERFFRVDKSRSRDTGGSGLGLAIVKHVLNHHHAELAINSKWGEGSEFIIYFDPKCIKSLN